MTVCRRCKRQRRTSQFDVKNKATGSRRRICRVCCNEQWKRAYHQRKGSPVAKARVQQIVQRATNRKAAVLRLVNDACQVCGYKKYKGALAFHHLNPATKRFNLTVNRFQSAGRKLLQELKKCVVLCVRCHAEFHGGLVPASLIKAKHNVFVKILKTLEGVL